MADEYDFSELRDYLSGQIDLGGADILFDEPWTPVKPNRLAAPARVAAAPQPASFAPSAPRPAVQAAPVAPVAPAPSASEESPKPEAPALPIFDMPSARPVRKAASAFESVESLSAFYESIAGEPVYSGVQPLVRYEGPEHPQLLLLLASPRPDIVAGNFFSTSTGTMLARLFASLRVAQENIGVTYFYKGATARNLSPLLEAALRKMLTKELSFIAPQVMVTFGEPLFHQVFGKGKNFNDCAGTDMEFGGVKTCALVDAFAMEADKQLKLLTWKVHIPRGSYFKN